MKHILTFLFLINIAKAAVWDAKPGLHWDPYWEKKYQEFIKEEVEGDFFKKLGAAYRELPLDCADASYALRIYFSFKHQLPWKSSGAKWDKYYSGEFSNVMTEFDHIQSPDDKVAALIEFLLDRIGTHSLAYTDSYPIAFSDIKPGDHFMYRYCKEGSCTRHTYIIKDINADGTFDVLYGTQNRAKKKWPLGRKKREYFQHKPNDYDWGFKRFKLDVDAYKSSRKILLYNDEQYKVAERLTEDQFFDYTNAAVRVIKESPTKKVSRLTQSLCHALQSRLTVVGDAIKYMEEEGSQCMNEATFDIYSTPSRDTGIYKQYKKLQEYINTFTSETKVNSWMRDLAEGIFKRNRSSKNEKRQNEFCSLKITNGYKTKYVNLANFYHSLISGNVSYHPNDNIFQRWGFNEGRKTHCKAWYTSDINAEINRSNNSNGERRGLFGLW